MKESKNNYLSPAVKVVDFVIERGFEGSYTVNQPDTETDGMVEQMNYDEGNQELGWDWHIQ